MSLDPNTWTLKTQEAVNAAMRLATERSNPEVTPDHLLAALLRQDDGVVLPVVRKLGLDLIVHINQEGIARGTVLGQGHRTRGVHHAGDIDVILDRERHLDLVARLEVAVGRRAGLVGGDDAEEGRDGEGPEADAEMCMMAADTMEALGIKL